MHNALAWFVGIIWFVLLGGCATNAGTSTPAAVNEWKSTLVAGASTMQDKPLLQEHRGSVFQVRYAATAKLMVRNLTSGVDTLVWDGSTDLLRGDGIATYSDGKFFHVVWRAKLNKNHKTLGKEGDKMVLVSSSEDGAAFTEPKRISNADGAFAPEVAGTPDGDLYAVWQDERTSKTYDLYFNVSHDNGKTWKSQDIRVDPGEAGATFSAEPSISAHEGNVSVAWVETTSNGFILYVRSSKTRGETWDEPVPVATSSKSMYYPQLVRVKNRLFVYWYDDRQVMGAWSSDASGMWTHIPRLVNLADMGGTIRGMVAKSDKGGVVHLVHSARGAGNEDRSNQYYLRSDDGILFAASHRLNSGQEFLSTASLPSLAIGETNDILIAWTDYRHFRAVVMGIYSADNGKSWSQDFLMSKAPEKGIALFPHVIAVGNKLWLSFIQYQMENQERGYAAAMEHKQSSVPKEAFITSLPNKEALKNRVYAWWQSRLDADWKKSYELLDPFTRHQISKEKYVNSQGSVKYYDFEFVDMEMNGERRAVARVKYTFEVPEMEINGRKVSVPKKNTEALQDWIWVDGGWYMLYKDIMGRSNIEM